MSSLYEMLWNLGKASGCHQKSERSFFYKGKQYPVCARCTGVFLGYFIGGIIYAKINIPVWLCIVFCVIMFIDWFIQNIGLLESTNIRRLLTGIFCGVSFIQLYVDLIIYMAQTILKCIEI